MAIKDDIDAANNLYIGGTLKCKSSKSPKIKTGKLEIIRKPRNSFAKLSDIYHANKHPKSTAIPPILGVGLT